MFVKDFLIIFVFLIINHFVSHVAINFNVNHSTEQNTSLVSFVTLKTIMEE